MGRGSSKAGSGSVRISGLIDSADFNDFIRQNMSNDAFREFGQNNDMDDVKMLWYQERMKAETADIHEISAEEAIDTIRDNIPASYLDGWFRSADYGYKDKIADAVVSNPGTLNAGLNIAYKNYVDSLPDTTKAVSFQKWAKTPQTVYRGDSGRSYSTADVFTSFTPDKKVAQDFARQSNGSVHSTKIRPIDTFGSFQTTGEQEFLVPVKIKRK